jgi:hypothetical protein
MSIIFIVVKQITGTRQHDRNRQIAFKSQLCHILVLSCDTKPWRFYLVKSPVPSEVASSKTHLRAECGSPTPAIQASWEAEIRRNMVQGQPGQIVCEISISKITRAKWSGGMA